MTYDQSGQLVGAEVSTDIPEYTCDADAGVCNPTDAGSGF
jgi:hypothetical protein